MQKRIMPGRTKEEQAKLTLRQQKIYDFLTNNYIGVLASVSPDGGPHANVLYYVIDKRFVISFITRTGTKKHTNLSKNNRVMLVVCEADNQKAAQVTGKAIEIGDSNGVNAVAESIFTRFREADGNDTMPLTKLDAGEYTAYRIEPDQISLTTYAGPDKDAGGDTAKIFESIESFDLNAV